jgi:alpha-ketoglutarate-dependent taurine dioxygenase
MRLLKSAVADFNRGHLVPGCHTARIGGGGILYAGSADPRHHESAAADYAYDGVKRTANRTNQNYVEMPPKAAIPYSLEVPPSGGDTYFANMFAA